MSTSLEYRILPVLQRMGVDIDRLKNSKVLVVGAGGLGSRIVMSLAKYPIGEIRVVDNSNVDSENVGYQFYPLRMLGKPKAVAIAELAKEFYPWANILGLVLEAPDIGWYILGKKLGIQYDIEKRVKDLLDVMRDVDLVIVSTDTLGSRASVWLASMHLNKPFIDTGFRETYGHVYIWLQGYQCPLDYQLADLHGFTRAEPGYPVDPLTADLIALTAVKMAISILSRELSESMLISINMRYKNIDVLNNIIQVYPWAKGVCRHYNVALDSVHKAIKMLAEGGGND